MKSYFKFLSRNKLYTFIELFGLSVSLAFIILLFCYAKQEYGVTASQPHAKELYAIGASDDIGMTYSTAEKVSEKIPEIKDYTRMMEQEWDISAGADYYTTKTLGVDANFFEYVSCGLYDCDSRSVLNSVDNVLLSKSFAAKVFENEPSVGKTLVVKRGGKDVSLTVAGIFNDFENNLFIQVDVIANIKHPFLFSEKVCGINYMDNFGSVHAFVLLNNDADVNAVKEKLHNEYKNLWDFWDGSFLSGASLTRMDEIYFSEINGGYGVFRCGNRKMVDVLFIACLILLISAIFNYINLTVAQTGKRAKEMATRRLLGTYKRTIIFKFFGESFAFTLCCFLIGYFIAVSIAPYMQDWLQTTLNIKPDFVLISGYFAIIVIVSAISGILPACFVSRFKPIDVVRGSFRFRSKMIFSKIFIILQNVISVVLITMALTMNAQMNFLINLPKYYVSEDIACVNIFGALNRNGIDILQNRLNALPMVESTGLCGGTPAGGAGINLASCDGVDRYMVMIRLDSVAFNMFGFKVLEKYSDPVPTTAYYTKSAVRELGVKRDYVPDKERCPLPCGIIDDFRYGDALYDKSAYDKTGGINVVYFIPKDYKWATSIVLKTTGPHDVALRKIEKICDLTMKEITGTSRSLTVKYLDDLLDDGLIGTKNIMNIVLAFMVIAVLISALGLFAMSMYYTEQSAKSIAVRKVFGSTSREVVLFFVKSFLWQIVIAIAIALPVGYYVAEKYLSTFPTRINLSIWIFVVAVMISSVIAAVSIFEQVYVAANLNPVKNLKNE